MIFQFTLWGAMVILSWLLSVSRQHLVPVLLALLIYCSPSISFGILMLILLQVLAFVQASVGTRRENNGVTQKRFAVVMAGSMLAIFGHALGANGPGRTLGLVGLLLVIPNGVTGLFFSRFFERLTLRSYVGSVLIPAFATLEVLARWKSEIQGEIGDVWQVAVLLVGGVTVLVSGLMSLARLRIRPAIVFWTQSMVGFALISLASSDETLMRQALASLAVASITSVVLMSSAARMGKGHFTFSRVSTLGLPGLIGFVTLQSVGRILFELGIPWVGLGFLGFFMQAMVFVLCEPRTPLTALRSTMLRFWVVVAVQVATGCGMLWVMSGGLK